MGAYSKLKNYISRKLTTSEIQSEAPEPVKIPRVAVIDADDAQELDVRQMAEIRTTKAYQEFEKQIATGRFVWERIFLGVTTPDEIDIGDYWLMRHKDAQVKSLWLMLLNTVIFKGGDFHVPRKGTITPEQKEQDARILKFLRYVFNDHLDEGLEARLREVLTSMLFGFSATELIGEYVSDEPINEFMDRDVLFCWKKMFTIDPRRITHFVDFRGEPISINESLFSNLAGVQISISAGTHKPISPHKCLIMTVGREFGNWYGESMFRACYQYYYAKSQIMRMWLIFMENHASPTYMAIVADNKDRDKAKAILKSRHQGRTEIAVKGERMADGKLVPTIEFKMLEMPNVQGVVAGYKDFEDWADNQMSKAVLVPSMISNAPTGNTGTYAQSETHADTFLRVVEPIRREVCKLIKERMIKPMVEWNVGTVDVMPEYVFHPFEEKDKILLSQMIISLITARVVSPTESWIREELDLPELDDETKSLLTTPPSSLGSQTSDNNAGQLQTGGDTSELEKEQKEHPKLSPETVKQVVSDHEKGQMEGKSAFKTLLRTEPDGIKIMLIDAEQMKKKDSAWDWHDEGTKLQKVIGGHHWALGMGSYIPEDEVWVSSDVPIEQREMKIQHELHERLDMKNGMSYEQAHPLAEVPEAIQAYNQGLPEPPRVPAVDVKTKHDSLPAVKLSGNSSSDVLFWTKMDSNLRDVILTHLSDYVEHIKTQAIDVMKSDKLGEIDKLKSLSSKKFKTALSNELLNTFNATVARERDNIKTSYKIPSLKSDEGTYTIEDPALEYLKNFSFQTAGEIDDELLNKAKRILINGVASGKSSTQMETELNGIFAEFSQDRLENIVRTNTMTAYNEGTRVVYDDVPNLIGYRFDGVDDDRITDLCEYLNGRIISKDDPILDEYTPPFWYNCRTKLTPILTFDNLPVDFVPHAILAPWVQVNLKK